MFDIEIINNKLNELTHYLKELELYRAILKEELINSLSKQWIIFHGLQLCIQILVDVGNHILASLHINQIKDYTDIIDKLGENKIITNDFAKQIRGMSGLWNIIVHEYTAVKIDKVLDVLQNHLDDFNRFITQVKQYLEKKGK